MESFLLLMVDACCWAACSPVCALPCPVLSSPLGRRWVLGRLPGLQPLGLNPSGHLVLLLSHLVCIFSITHELGQLGVFTGF